MKPKITGVILAGGNDKGLITLHGKMLYQHVAERLNYQVNSLMISANRNLDVYRRDGLPVVSDMIPSFLGPLAGILTGLNNASTEWVIFSPCDVPDLPLNLVSQLWLGKGQAPAAYVNDGERIHPTLTLLHVSLAIPLEKYLAAGDRKLMIFLSSINANPVIFENQATAFDNLNTPEDCIQWEQSKRKNYE